MAGRTFDINELLVPDQLGVSISNRWTNWNNARQPKIAEWKELREYIFATDTTHTSNAKLPWSNKTVIPKLAQIRDNLFANYMATMFPKRDWLKWEGDSEEDEDKNKADAIQNYMVWVIERSDFKQEVGKLVADYIDYGNCFCTGS